MTAVGMSIKLFSSVDVEMRSGESTHTVSLGDKLINPVSWRQNNDCKCKDSLSIKAAMSIASNKEL